MASLEDEIRSAGGPLQLLQSGRSGAYQFPVKPEFSNWRDEQESWRTSAALMDLSLHMNDLTVKGPDTYRLLSDLGANSFRGFGPMKAKQLIAVGHDGNMIGDAILFCLGEDHVRIVGRPPVSNWVQFNAETGDYDVELSRDERSVQSDKPTREFYRLQLQGPNATKIFEKVNGGPLPEIKFFHMGTFHIGDYQTTALNHRMSGFPGLEFFGPWADLDGVRSTLLAAGAEFGITQIGGRAYASVAGESGWIANTVPAIYSSDEMKPFREWLPARSFEANLALGGSFVSDRIEDYYVTPWDLGYTHIAKFDHDFIGREALERRAGEKRRVKAWIRWDRDDVARIFSSMYEEGDKRFKYIETPAAFYTASQWDRVEKDGELVGVMNLPNYSSNVRGWISLGMIDEDAHVIGDRVEMVWGEPDGGRDTPFVERHTQTKVGATIIARPFSESTEGSGNR
ncbi:aminomethyl transferase family protein [Herbiconiux moechotypicola]|uniref:Aminomethyltransferase family protein n=1 Tax=Herbiconiux moechotypicola TaxID=637393 RepID=A0ABP5Q975_9MICO|nr:aminomethyl transferase family protein [Herbiconiux moechotypicola]MCS5729370.1 aminomethyl transferase family protein [Herbiconiux moechotypicola]